ncbi:MAG TPA: hypothetical protein VK427_02350, partial [Kofleriaceae bacterium]|nr:hypothetical protein [Kofleriaceae bacterium]
GVPSTLATTDAAGAFTLRSSASVGTSRIEVTPPASTGLPRLVATGSFDLGQPVQVRYAAMAIRDLAGATVRRAGVVQPNANVTIVGTLANAGTIGAGANVAAIGEVRVSAMANANGVVPTLRAPDALLAAVVTRDDTTYSTVDLRTTTPATIEAPPLTEVITQLRNATNAPLGGAVFEAVPTGTFAMAGAGSVRVVADASGAITARLAPGAPYDVQLSDPRGHELGRLAAPRTIVSLTPAQMTASYTLPKALQLKGTLSLTGNPIGNARVQILCVTCTGTAREIPLAESSSSAMGAFSVAVGDPGTM